MFFKVLKTLKHQPANGQASEPEIFIVEESELTHFLHEQLSPTHVLVFDRMESRNMYTLVNTED